MKKIIFYLFSILLVVSCKNDDDNVQFQPSYTNPVSHWQLIEIYADPGDGSGDFNPVDSNKTITFYSDNFISSNGTLCTIGAIATESSYGTYTTGETNTITPISCNVEATYMITYVIENNFLIINHPCIEGCAEKYELIE